MSDSLNPVNPVGSLGGDAEEVEEEVEAALGQLEALPDLAVTDHVAVFEGVQQRLSEILSNVDDV